jgi:hypothetical protein
MRSQIADVKVDVDLSRMLCILCGQHIRPKDDGSAHGVMAPIRKPDTPTVAVCDKCLPKLPTHTVEGR